jgi:hypothetical protein
MGKKPQIGRPKIAAEKAKSRFLQVRLQEMEHESFAEAATLAGVPLSTWVRERLRKVAIKELEEHGQSAAFIAKRKRPS